MATFFAATKPSSWSIGAPNFWANAAGKILAIRSLIALLLETLRKYVITKGLSKKPKCGLQLHVAAHQRFHKRYPDFEPKPSSHKNNCQCCDLHLLHKYFSQNFELYLVPIQSPFDKLASFLLSLGDSERISWLFDLTNLTPIKIV
jgi:hypothetical protein